MDLPAVVSPQEWDAVPQDLLVKEKEHTRAAMRWPHNVAGCRGWRSKNDCLFDGPGGPASLLDLFDACDTGVEVTSSKMDESSERKVLTPPVEPAMVPTAAGTEATLQPVPPR
ncbi:hypothetical protein Mycsm_06355 [Mycobacterium sp. JS623]|nr:hypothetical protein Mycsm_06355 [Mycobacterium sp. JS623]